MKKITQIFIFFIVIMILSSLTFINIFKESFGSELSDEEKNIINNLTTYNTKIDNLQKSLPELNKNYNEIKNAKINTENKIKSSTSSLTNINSTNLTIENQLDNIQSILGTGKFHVIKELGINHNVQSSPNLLAANLLNINNINSTTTPTQAYDPIPSPASINEPTPIPPESTPIPTESSLTPTPIPTESSQLVSPEIAPFMDVAKKSKESFINLLNNIQERKPVEHFTETTNWRDVWNTKLESISRTTTLPISNTDPKIDDNETSFYIVQNSNLEKNLENTSSNIIKMQMETMTEILRDKWIKNNIN